MDVHLVDFPRDSERRRELAAGRKPRLLLVAPDAEPPADLDDYEDWVRVPVAEADLRTRVESLISRLVKTTPSRNAGAVDDRPDPHQIVLTDSGRLHHQGHHVDLSPIESVLARTLLDAGASVVARTDLEQQAWPQGTKNANTLEVSLSRLRKRLATVDLTVRTVRSRGYVLERT